MTTHARTAGLFAALLTIAAAQVDAQSSSLRVTIGSGPHAGTYAFTRGQCDALGGQVISMFTPKLAGIAAGPSVPESMELYTEPGRGGPDGFSVIVDFRSRTGERITYEIYAIPPELQAPGRNKPQKGRGTVRIAPAATGTTTFRGETAGGIRMEGAVTCGAQ